MVGGGPAGAPEEPLYLVLSVTLGPCFVLSGPAGVAVILNVEIELGSTKRMTLGFFGSLESAGADMFVVVSSAKGIAGSGGWWILGGLYGFGWRWLCNEWRVCDRRTGPWYTTVARPRGTQVVGYMPPLPFQRAISHATTLPLSRSPATFSPKSSLQSQIAPHTK